MAKKNGRFDLNKGSGNKFDLDKGPKRKFNLSKEVNDEVVDAADTAANAIATTEVKTPGMQVPAGVEVPKVDNPTVVDEAITYGPEEPKKKNTAWLWALIGIAIVLAIVAMLLLRKGDDTKDNSAYEPIESVEATNADEETAGGEAIEAEEAEVAVEDVEATAPEATAPEASTPAASVHEATTPEATAPAATAPTATSATESSKASAATPAAPASTKSTSQARQSTGTSAQSTPARTSTPTGDLDQDVKNAIRGDYGDGSARKEVLGDRYREIQRQVNRRMRSGKY